jgi:hypothetical protein
LTSQNQRSFRAQNPELLNAEPGPAVPLIDGSAPLLSNEDETVKMDDVMADQPKPEIFEQTSPDPTPPTQFQCMTTAPAFEETHLAGDQYETLTTQLDTEITVSPLATSHNEF